jgi:hypothetical protein
MNEAVEDPAAVSPGRRRRTVQYGLAVAAIISGGTSGQRAWAPRWYSDHHCRRVHPGEVDARSLQLHSDR